MNAATLDILSAGRFRLGLGVSGPQVSEGWHGVPFDKPLERTREYIDIVRLTLDRNLVKYDGRHFQLPLPDGPGKALRLGIEPHRDRIPIYLAALGPKNLELCGQVADGWLAMFFCPELSEEAMAQVAAGRSKVGRDLAGFDVVSTVPLVVGNDLEHCAQAIRPNAALYIGGMGSRHQNFYHAQAARMGYAEGANEVQRRYLGRDYLGAAAAVPFEFIDRTSLMGPKQRIAGRMAEFAAAGVSTLAVSIHTETIDEGIATLQVAADALAMSGVGE
jgi:F420-dependent oxidoreductase-like protein